ncbi:protein-methionine-sulfoxide reductase catalytic subunit MsrP [Rhodobacteraceae bacterium WD3A24]|nr:protein-methionine-sulfoxide reductase catalytic subunit MsrP [Rhodobacteraceae bacterium WD3A24]
MRRTHFPKAFTPDLGWADVTPKPLFMNRRALMAGGAAALAAGALPRAALAAWEDDWTGGEEIAASRFSTDEEPNSLDEITNYNNFFEFGTGKEDPARNADALTTEPWEITVDGLVENPGTYDLAELVGGLPLEERIYRLRCVEAWSMVIPWVGFELRTLLDRIGVRPEARFVGFETLVRPEEMPGQRRGILEWPYRDGLRLDEARNPLTIMATGLYREPLPNVNGAPIRLVVPWKYGFKSIKSIVRITLTEEQPVCTWNQQNPREYGFYSNVNPNVDHPRWSQATERRIGGGLFNSRQPTQMFNGYEEYVADLYAGMDLSEHF